MSAAARAALANAKARPAQKEEAAERKGGFRPRLRRRWTNDAPTAATGQRASRGCALPSSSLSTDA